MYEPKFGGTVTDVDGNVYNTVTIGTQTWMIENLRTTHYNDNLAITLVTDSSVWGNSTTGAYCWYNNDSATFKTSSGALYNWYAVNTTKLAPIGWHVATADEWLTLENAVSSYISTSKTIAKVLASTTGWRQSLNSGTVGNYPVINNSSGFAALPCGYRINYSHSFSRKDSLGSWWTSTQSDTTRYAVGMSIRFDQSYVDQRAYAKWNGFSVRCVKD
ncbi:MAG: fibrobacter succinogenes major paralogous domain-containing protein [Paludibacter sp.]